MDLGDSFVQGNPLGLTDGTRSVLGFGLGFTPSGSHGRGADGGETALSGKRIQQASGSRINNLNIQTDHPQSSGLAGRASAVRVSGNPTDIRDQRQAKIWSRALALTAD